MEGKRFIHKLKLQNFLSFGIDGEEIELQPLNVIIGANGTGKSNLIEAIGVLKATPTNLLTPIRQGGGINEFLWKGDNDIPTAQIEAIVEYSDEPVRYRIGFTLVGQKLEIVDEVIEYQNIHPWQENPDFFYRFQNGTSLINFLEPLGAERLKNPIVTGNLIRNQSILSQIKFFDLYPEITYLVIQFSGIGLYQDWHIRRNSRARMPQQTDLPEQPLLEDGSKLGVFWNNLQHQLGTRKIIEKLNKFYESAEELTTKIYGGTVQIFIRETGLIQPIPATRLSDGTLHYLFLMALLLDPTPPPLLCIEEPEIGFHPDIMPTIAEMLIEASQRTQLIVTTHSDALVSALNPESVLVCERDDRGSHLRRLEPEKLKNWLEKYSLGDLWRMGEIGGNRW